MSPEQASGATNKVGPASDIYALGAILYQLLTGRPPFQAETPLDTLSQLLESDPLPPRLLNRNVPRELEAICMQCLEKEPSRRYLSARDLGDDLERYLDGEAIQASGVNLLDRVTRALRQSRHEEHFRGWGLGLMAFPWGRCCVGKHPKYAADGRASSCQCHADSRAGARPPSLD